MTSSFPTKAITGSDIFLINRNGVSYTITAQQAKDVVNPEGIMYDPTIENIVDQQGYGILSGSIEFNTSTASGVTLQTVYSVDIVSITEFPERIEMSEPYVPITTPVESVTQSGDDYILRFRNVNYDIKLFKAGDFVKLGSTGAEGEIDSVSVNSNEMTIKSTDNGWIFSKNERVTLDDTKTDPITAEGDLTSITVAADGKTIDCTVENVVGTWITKYNNRSQVIKFKTSLPFGGFQVPVNGFEFIASPLDIREDDNTTPHKILELQKVTWRVNGRDIFEVEPVLGENVPQKFIPPDNILNDVMVDENNVNWISVTYKSGQYTTSSPRYYFIASSNPKGDYDTIKLLDRMTTFETDTTTLGL